MKKRILKKRNKKRHLDIVKNIEKKYTLEKIVFGDGYFLCEFDPHAISWFWLKEFPDWKFGIWLDKDDTYRIFGEANLLIDKFKPSASTLSKKNVQSFLKELKDIQNNIGEWKEYNKDIERQKKVYKKENEINKINYQRIYSFAEEEKNKFDKGETESFIKIVDQNTKNFKVSPRYRIEHYSYEEDFFTSEKGMKRKKELVEKLCNLMEYVGNYKKPDNFDNQHYSVDKYFFDNIEIINPQDYEEEQEDFSKYRKEKKKTFEDYIS